MSRKIKLEKWLDISDEIQRVYEFPTQFGIHDLTINEPVKLKVTRKTNQITGLPMDSHRVLDSRGVAHYIPPGWIALTWTSKKDDPFLF